MEHQDLLCAAFLSVLAHAQDMVFVKDTNLVYVAASDRVAHLVGRARGSDVVGCSDFDIFEPSLAQKYVEDDRRMLESGVDIEQYIERLPDARGEKIYSATSKFILRDQNGEIMGLCGIARDVTAQMELEDEREARQLSRCMFDDVLEADLTRDEMLRSDGSKWLRALGTHGGGSFTAVARCMAEQVVHPDYQADFLRRYDRAGLVEGFGRGEQEFSHITYLRAGDSDYRWQECQTRIYHSRISDTVRITTFFRDVDDETRSKQLLRKQADTDGLTGLYNRARVERCILEVVDRGLVQGLQALYFIDLDCFKQVNDCLGHRFGDMVLVEVAQRLRLCAGDEAVYGRIGGDEFLVFRWGLKDRADAEAWAKQILDALSFCYEEGENAVCVSCSIGVTLCPPDRLATETLCERADRAMYRAKENGRGQYFFYGD